MILHCFENAEFPFYHCFGFKRDTDLIVPRFCLFAGYKIYFPVSDDSYGNSISAADQLEEHDIFDDTGYIFHPVSEKPSAQSDISGIVLFGIFQMLFALNIEALNAV